MANQGRVVLPIFYYILSKHKKEIVSMNVLDRIENTFGGIDEQAMTEQLEAVIGSPDKCFRLMRIAQGPPPLSEESFRKKAIAKGFTEREINAYIEYASVV